MSLKRTATKMMKMLRVQQIWAMPKPMLMKIRPTQLLVGLQLKKEERQQTYLPERNGVSVIANKAVPAATEQLHSLKTQKEALLRDLSRDKKDNDRLHHFN